MEMTSEAFSRLSLLLGAGGLEKLSQAAVLLVGCGGVGSWAAETLARSGIGRIVLMDPDTVKASNLNRQLCALHSTLGLPKAEVLAGRMRDISPDASIEARVHRLQPEECEALVLSENWNCVIDAIDERPPKLALLVACRNHGIPVISSMGAANKRRPELVQVADISETSGCPLARIVRKNLRKLGVENGIRVVFSPELPEERALSDEVEEAGAKRPIGTISYLPALFGLRCAAEAVSFCLKAEENTKHTE